MKKFIKKNLLCIILCILLACIILTYSIRTYNSMLEHDILHKEYDLMRDNMIEMQKTIDSLNNELQSRSCNWMPLISAMITVESQGDANAIGSGDSYGVLQIRDILVKECNNILKSKNINKYYVHTDAFDKDKSIEMFHIIADKYAPDGDYEKMARIWNGGPNAFKKFIVENNETIENKSYISTNIYWEKVEKELNKELNYL